MSTLSEHATRSRSRISSLARGKRLSNLLSTVFQRLTQLLEALRVHYTSLRSSVARSAAHSSLTCQPQPEKLRYLRRSTSWKKMDQIDERAGSHLATHHRELQAMPARPKSPIRTAFTWWWRDANHLCLTNFKADFVKSYSKPLSFDVKSLKSLLFT